MVDDLTNGIKPIAFTKITMFESALGASLIGTERPTYDILSLIKMDSLMLIGTPKKGGKVSFSSSPNFQHLFYGFSCLAWSHNFAVYIALSNISSITYLLAYPRRRVLSMKVSKTSTAENSCLSMNATSSKAEQPIILCFSYGCKAKLTRYLSRISCILRLRFSLICLAARTDYF